MKSTWRHHPLLLVVCIASFGLAAGGAWEVIEYAAGVIGDMRDTMFDLIADALGAVSAGVLAAWWVKKSPVNPVRPPRVAEAGLL